MNCTIGGVEYVAVRGSWGCNGCAGQDSDLCLELPPCGLSSLPGAPAPVIFRKAAEVLVVAVAPMDDAQVVAVFAPGQPVRFQ